MSSKGRRKGHYGMDRAVVYFTKVAQELKLDVSFFKNPRPGSGDIWASSIERFPWSIEVKNQAAWKYGQFFNSRGSITSCVRLYWMQAVRDTVKVSKEKDIKLETMLWFTNSREPTFLLMRDITMFPRLNVQFLHHKAKFPVLWLKHDGLMVFNLPKPETFAKLMVIK